MNRRISLVLIILIFFTVEILSQTVKITGTVVSKTDGETLIGATVREVGTQKAAITETTTLFILLTECLQSRVCMSLTAMTSSQYKY